MEHAKRFRALLADQGLKHPEAAQFLHVSLRTLQNWLSGRHEVPYSVLKLLRLLRYMELPGVAWAGWHFSRGQLVTPEGRTISGKDGSWWSLLVRQSRGFTSLYTELQALRTAAQTPAPARSEARTGAGDGAAVLVAPVAGCYAESCLPQNSLQPAQPELNPPLGNHGDNQTITGPIWGHPDTIPESWPLISDFLLPSIPSPATTAIGSESPSIASLASPLTLICDNLSQPSRPPLPSPLPPLLRPLLRPLQSLPCGPSSKRSTASSPSSPLSAFLSPSLSRILSPSSVPSRPRRSGPTSPPGTGATAKPAHGVRA